MSVALDCAFHLLFLDGRELAFLINEACRSRYASFVESKNVHTLSFDKVRELVSAQPLVRE